MEGRVGWEEEPALDFARRRCYHAGMEEKPQTGERKRDTGVATLWFSCNYGAILTSYALYRVLEEMGKKPVLLDYAPLMGPSWRGAREDNISVSFMKRHGICCTEPLERDDDFNALNDRLDTFVIGSDQVWRWLYTKQCGYAYFLDYVRGERRKVAYASSFGIDRDERPEESLAKARRYLQAFDAVSVRERSGVGILQDAYGVEGECVLDPVFLCGREAYDQLTATQPREEEPCILSYVLEPKSEIHRHIAALAKERGLKVVNIVDAQRDASQWASCFECGEVAADVTPERWLHYIRHCEFFVTDSFHGVCYALIYNRPFVCVAPPERGLARFESILSMMGLQRCLLPPDCGEAEWQEALRPIDWEAVNTVMNAERERSTQWLHTALTAPRAAEREELGCRLHASLYAGSGAKDRYPEMEARLAGSWTSCTKSLVLQAKILKAAYCILARLSPDATAMFFWRKAGQMKLFAHYLSIRNTSQTHGM